MAKAYPPNHLSIAESAAADRNDATRPPGAVPEDATLAAYVSTFLKQYRRIIDRFFASLAPVLSMYARAPFESTVVRMGPNGVIIAHRPAATPSVAVVQFDDLEPPLERGWTIFTLRDRLDAPFFSFDFTGRPYDQHQAEVEGTRAALHDALSGFWYLIDARRFAELGRELLRLQEIAADGEGSIGDRTFDAVARVLLPEPAGFRREERWAFEFRHYRTERVSALHVRELEDYLSRAADEPDVVCVLTSGDLTSIGNHLAVRNPRIRLWDRAVLDHLIHQHFALLSTFFTEYAAALDTVSKEFGYAGHTPRQLEAFRARLAACPSGEEAFADYETLGTEIWRYLFPTQLGEPKLQRRTLDGTQRRDVLFRNERATKFFARVADRFGADFLIIDFKNYGKPIDGSTVDGVAKYANKAIGRFVCVVARKGAGGGVVAAQARILREEGTAIVVISDQQMLEMVERRERGEAPEDVLEDALDELLIQY